MGASQSKTSVDIVNNSIINVITNNANNCTANSTQTQQVSLGGFGFLTNVTQSATLNVSCLQKITMTTDLSTQIAQQIQQDAAAQSIALLPSYSGSNSTAKLANYIQTNVTTNIIQNCATGAIQSQQVAVSGIQIGASATQTLNLFTKCMQTALNNNNVAQGIVQNTNQTASSTVTNPLDFLSGIFSSAVLGFIAVIILVIIVVYMMFGGSNPPPPVVIPTSPEINPEMQSQT